MVMFSEPGSKILKKRRLVVRGWESKGGTGEGGEPSVEELVEQLLF